MIRTEHTRNNNFNIGEPSNVYWIYVSGVVRGSSEQLGSPAATLQLGSYEVDLFAAPGLVDSSEVLWGSVNRVVCFRNVTSESVRLNNYSLLNFGLHIAYEPVNEVKTAGCCCQNTG